MINPLTGKEILDKRYPDKQPLFDFPCSRAFREYEALIDDGISLPSAKPFEPTPVKPINEQDLYSVRHLSTIIVVQGHEIKQLQKEVKNLRQLKKEKIRGAGGIEL